MAIACAQGTINDTSLLCTASVAGWHLVLVTEMSTKGNRQSAATFLCQLCLSFWRPRSGDMESCTKWLGQRNGESSSSYCTAKYMPANDPYSWDKKSCQLSCFLARQRLSMECLSVLSSWGPVDGRSALGNHSKMCMSPCTVLHT